MRDSIPDSGITRLGIILPVLGVGVNGVSVRGCVCVSGLLTPASRLSRVGLEVEQPVLPAARSHPGPRSTRWGSRTTRPRCVSSVSVTHGGRVIIGSRGCDCEEISPAFWSSGTKLEF